ncbi:hypothetical protein LUZ60_004139 [Juncus effusus]|nr:hypothetical protein LUZ60_004139 [Juncus effusus]
MVSSVSAGVAMARVTVQIQAVQLAPVSAAKRAYGKQRVAFPLQSFSFSFEPLVFNSHSHSLLCSKSRLLIRPCCTVNQAGDSNNNEKTSNISSHNVGKSVLSFLTNNFLPLALIGGVVLGLLNPNPGCVAHKYSLSKFSTFAIFFISGLILRTSELGAAIEAWPAGLFGLSSILVLTPLFSKLIMQIQLQPPEFVTGVAVFCCMPTTLSSGVTLTQLVGGNSALALAMTVISNLLGIITVPISLASYIASGTGVNFPTFKLLKSLVNSLLIPLVLGKILREASSGVAKFVDRNKKSFSVLSAILLSLVPWIQVSKSRSLLLNVKPQSFALAIIIGLVLHCILLAVNAISLLLLSRNKKINSIFAKKEYARAVILVASQKTLPVTVAVVEQLCGALGESGLLILPCVAAHINQIIIDSILVSWWRKNDQRLNEAKDL